MSDKLTPHPLPPDDVVRDAERYRFIRKQCVFEQRYISVAIPTTYSWEIVRIPHDLDAVIDAAMKEQK